MWFSVFTGHQDGLVKEWNNSEDRVEGKGQHKKLPLWLKYAIAVYNLTTPDSHKVISYTHQFQAA